jgi:Zn-dependent peptidase ImmA (M78 family)
MLAEYISQEDLELMAIGALSGFERKHGAILKWPVPLDQFIEQHLGLTIQFSQLPPNILGCLSVKDRIVTINEVLDTYGRPQNEGRCNFTIAHEGGHEIAHAPQIRTRAELQDLFGKPSNTDTTILCRKDNQDAKIEYQANYIGAATLMPKKLMHLFWKDRFGDLRQRDERALLHKIRLDEDFVSNVGRMRRGDDGDDALLEEHFRGIAKEFTVSPEAFCRRLRTLGLLGSQNSRELFARIGA